MRGFRPPPRNCRTSIDNRQWYSGYRTPLAILTRVVSKLKKVIPGIGSRFVKHTRKAKKVYLGLMKVMEGRTGKDDGILKEARDELVKVEEPLQ